MEILLVASVAVICIAIWWFVFKRPELAKKKLFEEAREREQERWANIARVEKAERKKVQKEQEIERHKVTEQIEEDRKLAIQRREDEEKNRRTSRAQNEARNNAEWRDNNRKIADREKEARASQLRIEKLHAERVAKQAQEYRARVELEEEEARKKARKEQEIERRKVTEQIEEDRKRAVKLRETEEKNRAAAQAQNEASKQVQNRSLPEADREIEARGKEARANQLRIERLHAERAAKQAEEHQARIEREEEARKSAQSLLIKQQAEEIKRKQQREAAEIKQKQELQAAEVLRKQKEADEVKKKLALEHAAAEARQKKKLDKEASEAKFKETAEAKIKKGAEWKAADESIKQALDRKAAEAKEVAQKEAVKSSKRAERTRTEPHSQTTGTPAKTPRKPSIRKSRKVEIAPLFHSEYLWDRDEELELLEAEVLFWEAAESDLYSEEEEVEFEWEAFELSAAELEVVETEALYLETVESELYDRERGFEWEAYELECIAQDAMEEEYALNNLEFEEEEWFLRYEVGQVKPARRLVTTPARLIEKLLPGKETQKKDWLKFQQALKKHNISRLYHFTDRENLVSIRAAGGLLSWYSCKQNDIGIARPGGSEASWQLDSHKGLADYVRLAFIPDHPMMYVARKDGRLKSPIILEIDPAVIFLQETKFSEMNAVKNGVFANSNLDKFSEIKFNIFSKRFFDLTDDEKPYYQAEVLVHRMLPAKYILNLDRLPV